ncbi:MAG: hypothetical protein LBE12_09535 [Planctomycetaceae bacterium]|jgi:hypothetical protein|nr:hypothetical protein [Planctomycetaceae bacterium]
MVHSFLLAKLPVTAKPVSYEKHSIIGDFFEKHGQRKNIVVNFTTLS